MNPVRLAWVSGQCGVLRDERSCCGFARDLPKHKAKSMRSKMSLSTCRYTVSQSHPHSHRIEHLTNDPLTHLRCPGRGSSKVEMCTARQEEQKVDRYTIARLMIQPEVTREVLSIQGRKTTQDTHKQQEFTQHTLLTATTDAPTPKQPPHQNRYRSHQLQASQHFLDEQTNEQRGRIQQLQLQTQRVVVRYNEDGGKL
jgi:hypothetical protein